MQNNMWVGFTVLELLIALTTGLLLLSGVFTILYQSYAMMDSMKGSMVLNQQIRETFNLLSNGRTEGLEEEQRVYGLSGIDKLDNLKIGREENEFRLMLGNNGNQLLSSRARTSEVECTGENVPLVGCTSGNRITVHGYLAQDVNVIADSDINNTNISDDDWVIVTISLINPNMEGQMLVMDGISSTKIYFLFGFNKEL